mmetsp:Transcript_131653/g.380810  ORF Transcript_131653/g.380810 Transcript_131653/m.380810 type:complete len:410 (+) Transcript_131653:122-1351(+)
MVTIGGSRRGFEIVQRVVRKLGGSSFGSAASEESSAEDFQNLSDVLSEFSVFYRIFPPRRLRLVLKTIKAVGEGGYGRVFTATPTEAGLRRVPVLTADQVYAVKLLKQAGTSQFASTISAHVNRTSKEKLCESLALLRSQEAHEAHVVTIFAIFEEVPWKVYILMEYLQGPDLFDFLALRIRPVDEFQARTLAKQIFAALAFLHGRVGLIHRDVKPENLCFARQFDREAIGEPMPPIKLLDFGLAWLLPEPVTESTARDMQPMPRAGTRLYMAPEIWDGWLGPSSDVWSAGIVVHLLLSADLPFQLGKSKDCAAAIATGALDFAAEGWATVGPDARDFVARALTKATAARATVAELTQSSWLRSEHGPGPQGQSGGSRRAGCIPSLTSRSKAECTSAVMWNFIPDAGPM